MGDAALERGCNGSAAPVVLGLSPPPLRPILGPAATVAMSPAGMVHHSS